ncbi:MAG: hypothetical protein Kow00109_21890 [Acidobacteriota bacterium]
MRLGTHVLLLFALSFLQEDPEVFKNSFFGLRIPEFSVEEVTMREALAELSRYGIRICYEEAPLPETGEQVRFSIQNQDVSILGLLRQLVGADPRYTFQFPRGLWYPAVNVFPVATLMDPEYLMNLQVEELHLEVNNSTNSVYRVLREIQWRIPELRDRLPPPSTVVGSWISGAPGGPVDVNMEFTFRNMTIRELLTELILRSDAEEGWWFIPEPKPRWDVFPPARTEKSP